MRHSEKSRAAISASVKRRWKEKEFEKINWHTVGAKGSKGKYKNPLVITDISTRTISKILKRLIEIENLGCCICGWNEGVGDLHHINGKKIKNPNNHKNLSYVCPNCHRLVHEGKIKKEQLISFFDQIGDNWKKYYFG